MIIFYQKLTLYNKSIYLAVISAVHTTLINQHIIIPWQGHLVIRELLVEITGTAITSGCPADWIARSFLYFVRRASGPCDVA